MSRFRYTRVLAIGYPIFTCSKCKKECQGSRSVSLESRTDTYSTDYIASWLDSAAKKSLVIELIPVGWLSYGNGDIRCPACFKEKRE